MLPPLQHFTHILDESKSLPGCGNQTLTSFGASGPKKLISGPLCSISFLRGPQRHIARLTATVATISARSIPTQFLPQTQNPQIYTLPSVKRLPLPVIAAVCSASNVTRRNYAQSVWETRRSVWYLTPRLAHFKRLLLMAKTRDMKFQGECTFDIATILYVRASKLLNLMTK